MGQHKEEHGMKKILMVTLAAALLLGAFAPAVAADQPEKDWRWDLAPLYGWFISVSGDITVNDRQGTIDLDFGDIFDNLDFIFTAHAEGVYQQRWGLWIDYSYVDLSKTVETLGPALDVGFTDNLSEGAAFYRFDKGVHTFDAFLGARYQKIDIGVQVRPAPEVGTDFDWWDGFAGLRWRWTFSDQWMLLARGDIGAGGSDFTWNATGLIGWQPWKHVGFLAGYRGFGFDYKTESNGNDLETDLTLSGPVAAINFTW
jgi:hypothetical protein